jgi:hypothetical protein
LLFPIISFPAHFGRLTQKTICEIRPSLFL